VVADRKDPCKGETPNAVGRAGQGNGHRVSVSGRLVLLKVTSGTYLWGPLLLVCYPETAVPADNCATAGGSRVSVSRRACGLAGLQLCRRAITIILHAFGPSEPWMFQPQAGIKVEGSRDSREV
jgi:hypothetical protein